MSRPLLLKLASIEPLSAEIEQVVTDLCSDTRSIRRGDHIVREGQRPEYVHAVLSGWLGRYNIVENGGRRFTALLLPGDFCDVYVTPITMDHNIIALTDCEVAFVRTGLLDSAMRSMPALARVLWRSAIVDMSILRRWLVRGGRSDAMQLVAHLFCELHARARVVGLTVGDRLAMPLSQQVIADATGLTPIHVNRVIKRIREAGLMTIAKGMLRIHDLAALHRLSGFNPDYLHLQSSWGPSLGHNARVDVP